MRILLLLTCVLAILFDLLAIGNAEGFSVTSSIPDITLTAERLRFPDKKLLAVYSGPGEEYMRGANGKAVVSTSDWIQVFGKENGWVMIQYAISDTHMRIGWIPEQDMPEGAKVEDLDFSHITAYTNKTTSITDDPLLSKANLLTLPEGCWVTCLATMDNWAYIESTTGDVLRGFVPTTDLRTYMQFDLRDWPVGDIPVLEGILTYDEATSNISIKIKPAKNCPITEELIALIVYDGISGKELYTIETKEDDGTFYDSFVTIEKTTSLVIVGKDFKGKVYNEWAVKIEW